MFTDSRKIQLLEDLLKLNDEVSLEDIENVLKKTKSKKLQLKKSAHEFLGLWNKRDVAQIEKAIAEGFN
jgi:hypothetical protein